MTVRTRVVAPWVRTRLRSAPGEAVALALLVAVTAFLAAALPLAADRYGDAGLRRSMEVAGPARTTVQLYSASAADLLLTPEEREEQLREDPIADAHAKILALPAIRDKLAAQGFELAPLQPPPAFTKLLREDMEKWPPIIKASGAKAD